MALSPVYVPAKRSGGGGLWGKIAGGIAGLAAAPFTGGMSIPAAIGATAGAMSLGSTVGGLIGQAASPGEAKAAGGLPTLNTAMKADPMAQMAMLTDAQKSAMKYPMQTDQLKEFYDYLETAKQNLNQRLKIGS